jgi:diguanylate cyclase (GGDEF)-like protein
MLQIKISMCECQWQTRAAQTQMTLDIRTMLIVMIATSLLLAVSLMVSVGPRFRDGLGKWTGAMLLQAVVFALYAVRGNWPDFASIVLPNALFVTCMTLQAAAVREFHGRPTSRWWHVIPALAVALLFVATLDKFLLRVTLSGVIFGSGLLALAVMVQRFNREDRGSARSLLLTGYLIGTTTMITRAVVSVLDPTAVPGFLSASAFQGITFLFGFIVILITSLGFLLLHKERSEDMAQKLSVIDPLTGAFNRRTFMELAEKEIARTRRTRGSLSLIMLDLDLFKQMNDRNGHLAGDEVLKGVVSVLLTCLRKEDLLVRYGGEEFCILLPGVAIDHAALMAERARNGVEQQRFFFDGKSLHVTISIGLAALSLDGNEGVDTLVSRADEALYAAKKAGRNRVVAFPSNTTLGMLLMSQRESPQVQ